MGSRLLWKLLGINIPVIVAVILVVWLAIDYLAADYFMVLMERYSISPGEIHQIFLSAVHRYLAWASIGALLLAVVLGFLLTRGVLRPLSEMIEVTRRIAAGDYRARVRVRSSDEIGRLGMAFNHMSDSLARVEQLRKNMVADAAHELRTPLTSMRGYLEGLRDGVVPANAQTFEILQSESIRMVKLVEDMLALARADAAGVHLRLEDVELHELLDQVLALNRFQFETKQISVRREYAADTGRVRVDRDKVLQAARNLADNACQYTPNGGAVRVCTERLVDGVRVAFVNTGEGIRQEDMPYIFERFYRADKSRSRDRGGAGIGLAIVKELIQAHGGRVGAGSAGGETKVWFQLPA